MNEDLTVDQRHIQRMREAIDLYRAKHISLGQLINNLEALLEMLESTPEDWKGAFLQEWGKLEDISAVSLDRGQPDFVKQNEQSINETLCRLEGLIKMQLPSDEGMDES